MALPQDPQLNDMRSWTPHMPMLLCSGNQDPDVAFDLSSEFFAQF